MEIQDFYKELFKAAIDHMLYFLLYMAIFAAGSFAAFYWISLRTEGEKENG